MNLKIIINVEATLFNQIEQNEKIKTNWNTWEAPGPVGEATQTKIPNKS